jgi:hypothetical protein
MDALLQQIVTDLASQLLSGLLGGLLGKRQLVDAFTTILNESLVHLQSIATSLLNTGLAAVLTTLQGKRGLLDDLLTGLGSTWDSLTSSLLQTGSDLLGAIQPHIDDLTTNLLASALGASQSLLGALAGISGTLQGKRGLWDDLLAGLNSQFSALTSSLVQVGSDLLTAVQPHIDDLTTQLATHGLNAAESLLGTLAAISGTLQGKRGLLDDFLLTLGSTWGNLTTQLTQVGSDLLAAVQPHIDDLTTQLATHGLNAAESLLGTLAAISGTLQG